MVTVDVPVKTGEELQGRRPVTVTGAVARIIVVIVAEIALDGIHHDCRRIAVSVIAVGEYLARIDYLAVSIYRTLRKPGGRTRRNAPVRLDVEE